MEELTFEERITMGINEDKEFWLDKVICQLEKLLDKANRDNKLQRKMAIHYYKKNQLCKGKIKELKAQLDETLINQEEKGKLDLLADASMVA